MKMSRSFWLPEVFFSDPPKPARSPLAIAASYLVSRSSLRYSKPPDTPKPSFAAGDFRPYWLRSLLEKTRVTICSVVEPLFSARPVRYCNAAGVTPPADHRL